MNLFVYTEAMWVFTCVCVSRGCLESEKHDRRVGVTALDIMSWDGKNWTSCWFHTDYFNREYLFWTWLTSFKSRHFKLSVHIFFMSLRQVFTKIHVVLFMCLWREVTESEKAENTPCLFSLFYESTLFCCYDDYTQIKVDPLQFQRIPYSYLYDPNWQSIFCYFAVIKKIETDRTGLSRLRPQGVKGKRDKSDFVTAHKPK